MKNVIISVDAGGTGTRYAIFDEHKNLIKEYTGTPGSPAININAEEDIYEQIKKIKDEFNEEFNVKCLVLGMSGFALVNTERFTKNLKSVYDVPIILENDGIIAFNYRRDRLKELFTALTKLYEDKKDITDYADLLYQQALLIAGLPIEDPVAYSNKITKLMLESMK